MAGLRFDFQQMPQGERGGLNLYPLSGVISGLVVSNVAAAGTGNLNMTFNLSAGQARIDGQVCTLASNVSGLTLPQTADLSTYTGVLNIYLNPRRIVPALTVAPSSPANGDRYLLVDDSLEYQRLLGAFQYNGTAFVNYDMTTAPPAYGHNNLPLNELNAVIDTAATNNASIKLTPEKVVYHKKTYPPYVSSQANAYLRVSASILLAQVTFTAGAIALKTYTDDLRLPL